MSFDLTPNRIFSRPLIRRSFGRFATGRAKIPWEGIKDIPYKRNLYNDDDALFRVGTVKDIRFKKSMDQMDQGVMCERCGQTNHKFPWSKNKSPLCDQCFAQLEKDYGADLWGNERKEENPEITHPWWFYI